jgi:hypothetical protein
LSTTHPAAAVHRRLMRALGDLGIAPQPVVAPEPVGDEPQRWATVETRDGETVIAFGALSLETAARLANLLEDLASGSSASSITQSDDDTHDPDGAAEYALAPFEPVASPLEPFHSSSRHHPRTAW